MGHEAATRTVVIDQLDDSDYSSSSAHRSNHQPGCRMRQSRRADKGGRRDTTASRWRPWLWPDIPSEESEEHARSPMVAPANDRAPVREGRDSLEEQGLA